MQHSGYKCVSKPNALSIRLKAKWRLIHLGWEKRRLESKLETILRSAQGHESSGLSPGDSQYRLLHDHAETICKEFAGRWEINRDLLIAQIPALCKLNRLAQPSPKRSTTGLVLLFVISTPVVLFIIGIIGGLMSVGFHFVGGK